MWFCFRISRVTKGKMEEIDSSIIQPSTTYTSHTNAKLTTKIAQTMAARTSLLIAAAAAVKIINQYSNHIYFDNNI